MKVEVHILTWNEEALIKYAVRHYRTFADKIMVHDARSTDRTREFAQWGGAEVVDWDTGNQFDDEMAMKLKNDCWRGTDADWVICADADEFIYFPQGAEAALASYSRTGAAVIKPHGWEMISDTYPTTGGQIYDEVKFGARDDKWYAKPLLFNPRIVAESGFGIGAHESDPVLKNGMKLRVGANFPRAVPPCYLLHFHQIGPVERTAALYDERRQRLCATNVRNRWGNIDDTGIVHAKMKRDYIRARLEQVIA